MLVCECCSESCVRWSVRRGEATPRGFPNSRGAYPGSSRCIVVVVVSVVWLLVVCGSALVQCLLWSCPGHGGCGWVVSRVPGVVVVVCLLFVLARWDKEGVVGESGVEEGVVGYVL